MIIEKLKKKYGIKYIFLAVVLLVFILGFVSSYKKNDKDTVTQTPKTSSQKQGEVLDDIDAYILGQYYVKQFLKSPATAVFPPIDFIINNF